MFHESLAATVDMAVLPGVLGCCALRRTVQVRLGPNTLRLPTGKTIFTVSRQQTWNIRASKDWWRGRDSVHREVVRFGEVLEAGELVNGSASKKQWYWGEKYIQDHIHLSKFDATLRMVMSTMWNNLNRTGNVLLRLYWAHFQVHSYLRNLHPFFIVPNFMIRLTPKTCQH